MPDHDTLRLMQRRESELQHSKGSRRAFSLPCCDRCAAALQIQLRVVREFDMVRMHTGEGTSNNVCSRLVIFETVVL